MAGLALLCFVVVVVLACWKNYNAGILAIAMTFLLCLISGRSMASALNAFNSSLFLRIAFASPVFVSLTVSGAGKLLVQKVIKKLGTRVIKVMPLFFVLITAVPAALGLGPFAMQAILATGAVVGVQIGLYPLLIPMMVTMFANTATLHPAQQVGIIVEGLANKEGFTNVAGGLFASSFILHTVLCIVLYVLFKGWKVGDNVDLGIDQELPKLNRNQWFSIAACIIMVVGLIAFKWEIAVWGAFMGALLLIVGVYNEKTYFSSMPMGIMFTVGGVGILIDLIVKLGGIDLIINFLQPILNAFTVTPIVSAMSGVLSWVSSTAGVVLPTIVPMMKSLIEGSGGHVAFTTLLVACVTSSHFAALSPFSVGGGYALGLVSGSIKEEERKKLVPQMFTISALSVLGHVVLSALGVVDLLARIFY